MELFQKTAKLLGDYTSLKPIVDYLVLGLCVVCWNKYFFVKSCPSKEVYEYNILCACVHVRKLEYKKLHTTEENLSWWWINFFYIEHLLRIIQNNHNLGILTLQAEGMSGAKTMKEINSVVIIIIIYYYFY